MSSFRPLSTPADPGLEAARAKQPCSFLQKWLIFLSCWSGAAVACPYVKNLLLREGGYAALGAQLGRIVNARHTENTFTLLEKLTFYRWDLLLVLVLVPIALLGLAKLVPMRFGIPAVYLLSSIIVFWLAVQRSSYVLTGRFLSVPFILNAFSWANRHPADFKEYAAPSTFAKVGLVLAVSAGLPALLLIFFRRRNNKVKIAPSGSSPFLGFCLAAIALLILLSFGPWLRATAYHQSVLSLIYSFTFPKDDAVGAQLVSLSDTELIAQFRGLADEPQVAPAVSSFHGKARDYDVIVWVAETLPQKVVARRGGLTGFPSMATLADASLLLNEHYTTVPYSSLAMFSILSSLYPPNNLQRVTGPNHRNLPGLFSEAGALGYETAVFLPGDASFKEDMEMFAATGPRKVFVSEQKQAQYEKTSWQNRLLFDEVAFAELLRSIEDWSSRDKRYMVVFFPQIGHAPWADVSALGPSASRLQLGEAIVDLQDRWIGRIIEVLKRRNRFRKTLILVTGDHGIRTRVEDPAEAQAVMDGYTFNVPLLLYAPGIFSAATKVSGVTSHIDIAPSLLDLLGAEKQPPFFQGLPFWDPAVRSRRVFFLGGPTVGCDGMHTDKGFYTLQTLSRSVLFNDVMEAAGARAVVDPVEKAYVSDSLHTLMRMQTVLLPRVMGAQASRK
jgi:phosphoglycerol transferase MdoB-like AlkP superfamily enzyme